MLLSNFAKYNRVKGASPKTVSIFTYRSPTGDWDPDKVKTGLTGSEEAVVYMSQELANLGYDVTVYANIPPSSPYSTSKSNPRFIEIGSRTTHCDIGISWRMPFSGSLLKSIAQKAYLWPHDCLTFSPAKLSEEDINAFDGVLWLSESQRKQWSSYYSGFGQFTDIFGNGIPAAQFSPILQRENPYSCIYGSSYDRGLHLLLDVWPAVKERFPRATLDIYYGAKLMHPTEVAIIYSRLSKMTHLDVREHGAVGHEELTRAYERTSFWTYPCTAPQVETFCITALRAQFAGAVPVILEGGALKETVQHGYKCSLAQEYLDTLLKAMREAETISIEQRKLQREFVLEKYTWLGIASRWKQLFDSDWSV
jgi:glycosyltransferase involved in cell wall biosynthesis